MFLVYLLGRLRFFFFFGIRDTSRSIEATHDLLDIVFNYQSNGRKVVTLTPFWSARQLRVVCLYKL